MKILSSNWPLIVALLIITACQSQVEQVEKTQGNKFDDPELIKIYDLVDKRSTAELLPYLAHANSLYRYEAALGLGSVQDTIAIAKLAIALNDDSPKVRRAAAYALGQTRDTNAIAPLVRTLEEEDSVFVRKELFESLGKVITQERLRILQYWPLKSSDDKEGLAWGLYRAGIRNVHDGISVDIALSLLDSTNSYLTRLGAAQFLARSRNLDLTDRSALIIKSATQDISPFVRMASALALSKTKDQASLKALIGLISAEDYRIRINALRALGAYDFEKTKSSFEKSISDENVNVSITAIGQIDVLATKKDEAFVKNLLKPTLNWRVKASLLGTILKLVDDKQQIITDIKAEYEKTENDYYKAALLTALGNSLLANEFVITKTFSETSSPIMSAGISALVAMRYEESFPDKLKAPFAEIFKQAIETKDIAMIANACSTLSDPALNFKEQFESFGFLNEVRSNLKLPKDIEAIQIIDQTIAFFNDAEYEAPKNDFNHPIDWELVKQIEQNQPVLIKTAKGDITLRLLVEDAPGSVANFVELLTKGYYNGKNFHRVVPNFVIQGGCNRGDGFGGEAYSIRSEFANLKYEEGSVGMASAGKDTEGTQWFITHSPTPHLDGAYSIFAKVIDGMDVVHQMEIGDKIVSVELQ